MSSFHPVTAEKTDCLLFSLGFYSPSWQRYSSPAALQTVPSGLILLRFAVSWSHLQLRQTARLFHTSTVQTCIERCFWRQGETEKGFGTPHRKERAPCKFTFSPSHRALSLTLLGLHHKWHPLADSARPNKHRQHKRRQPVCTSASLPVANSTTVCTLTFPLLYSK